MLFKKITAICVLICFALSCFPVYAQTQCIIDTVDYSSYSGYMNVNGDGKPDPGCGMGNNTTVVYNNISPGSSGQYMLTVELIGVYGANSTMSVLKDDVQLISASLPQTQTRISVEIGEIGLDGNNNCLSFKFTNTESVYFTQFTLIKTGVRTQYSVNADKADRMSEIGITDNKPSEGMNTGRYAEYDIYIDQGGTYKLSISGATLEEITAGITLTVDGENYGTVLLPGEGWYTSLTVEFPLFELNGGVHNFNITISSEAIRLFSLSIEGITTEISENFLDEVYSASTTSELDIVFDKYDGKLFNSYKALSQNIIYKDLCYKKIREIGTVAFSEFDKKAVAYLKEEQNNPTVSFWRDGEMLTSLTEGSFDVHISPKFAKRQTAIVALYKNDGKTLSIARHVAIKPFEEAVIEGMYTDGAETLRVFFWSNLDNLTPMELPTRDTHIFVSPTGDDTASGGYNTPLKTITGAIERIRETQAPLMDDVVVNLMPGQYFVPETLTLSEQDGGTSNTHVTYRSFDSENPATISGGVSITGWQHYKDGIYMAQTDGIDDVRQLYIDGYPAVRARGDSVFYAASSYDDPLTSYEQDGFVVESTAFPTLAKPKDVEICYNILWTLQRLPVSSIAAGDGTYIVRMDQPYYSRAITMQCEGGIQPISGMQFFVENDLTLLDEAGEFYFDKDTAIVYYKPFSHEDLSKVNCVVPVTEQLICASGSSAESKLMNLSFENLVFRYGAYTEANVKGTTSFQAECLASEQLNVNPADTATGIRLKAQLEFTNASNISFNNCDISCMGSTALSFGDGTDNSSVTGCLMRDNGGSAVSVGEFNYTSASLPDNIARNIIVENNIIARPGIDFMFCPGISVYYANGVNIINNDISCTPYSGISLGWGWGSPVADTVGSGSHTISGNKITDISNAVRDGGHIYLLGGLDNTVVSQNFISDSTDYGGIYLDSGSKGIIIEENVCEKCKNWLFGGETSSNVAVKNNYTDGSDSNFDVNADKGVTYTEPLVYTNSNWTDDALKIYSQSGISETHFDSSDADLPSWRQDTIFAIPHTEKILDGEYLIEAEDYDGYATNSGKTEPSLHIQGFRTVMGDIRQFDVMDYEVEVEKAGDYEFEIRYTTGPYNPDAGVVAISVMVDNEDVLSNRTLPFTNTSWAAVTPYIAGTLTLKEGINKLSIKSLRNGFAFDNIKLIKR